MAAAVITALAIWMGGFWMGNELTSEASGFAMKQRQSLFPIFFFDIGKHTTKRYKVILPAIVLQASAYALLSAAILIKLFISSSYSEKTVAILSIIWFILSFLFHCCIDAVYYLRVHRNSPERLITILEDIGFPAERFLHVRATLVSIDDEITSQNGRRKYVCTIKRKRDGKLIHPVLLEVDGLKSGDSVKVSFFSSGLTAYPYAIIARSLPRSR